MTSIKSSYSTSGSTVGSYFYEYEYEYRVPASFKGSMSQMGSNSGSCNLITNGEGAVKRVLGYGINLI